MKKTTSEAPAFASEKKAVASKDKLDELKEMVRRGRSLMMEIEELDIAKAKKVAELTKLRKEDLPTFAKKVGVPYIEVDAEGNNPSFACQVEPFYSANIKSDWPPELRDQGFDYLEKMGWGEIIKTYVTFSFPKELQPLVVPFIKACKAMRLSATITEKRGKASVKKKVKMPPPSPEIERTVPHATLTKWLKERVEKDEVMPDLEKIGGFVGEIAKLSVVKEKKA